MYGTKTYYTYLKEFVRDCPDKFMIGYDDVWMTNSQVLERVESVAYFLRQQGVQKGDMVAIMMSNSVQSTIALLALQSLNTLAVLCDCRHQVEPYLRDCIVEIPASYIITNEETTRGSWDGENLVFIDRTTGKRTPMEILDLPSQACPEEHDVDSKAPGFIIFTSGSTGKRKAVMLSQYGIVSTLHANAEYAYYGPYDIALGLLPMDHIFGLILMTGTFVLRHAIYLAKDKNLPTILSAIQEKGITRLNGTPQLFLALASMKDQYDLSGLKAGLVGGAPHTPEQFYQIENALNVTLSDIYAMTEYTHIAVGNWRDSQQIRATNNGKFCTMNTGKILRHDGTEADVGEVGEICVDGPARMVGYYGDPDSFHGMIHTGDLGVVDADGYLTICGRLKDIIIRNGKNLSPKRIEDAILAVPGVKNVCVKGVPNEAVGEVPCAMVVAPGVTQEVIEEHIRKTLNKNELPFGYLFVDELPVIGIGKADKQGIQKTLTEQFKA